MSKIVENIIEPSKVYAGSTFLLKIKAIRYMLCKEMKTITCKEAKQYTCGQVKGV